MTSEPPEAASGLTDASSSDKTSRRPAMSTKTKVIVGVAAALIVVIGYFLLARFLPEWWARSMGARIEGSFTSGTMYGLFFGIIGSVLPLILGLLAFFTVGVGPRNILSWILGAIALVSLIPNLLTLTVVAGGGSGARIGRRIFDIDAPSFRGSTVIGLCIGLVADFYLVRRRRRKARDARVAA